VSMTVVVTRNVPDRFRGFLASAMLEVAPGIYTSPRMSAGVRERIWDVCCSWAGLLPNDAGLLMTWRDPKSPGGQGLRTIGWPKAEHVELDGLWLARRGSTDSPLDDNASPDAAVAASTSLKTE
jgi:CRISPR-associated protein Cas2